MFFLNNSVVKMPPKSTVYDSEGNWTVYQHQEQLRTMKNEKFETYYRDHQKLVPLDQWDKFLEEIRSPLPTTVWINDTDPLAGSVSDFFRAMDPSLVEPIPWYPIEGMAWRILADKALFRKKPEMQPLRQYLIRQTALGTISRQEEVSMIPPFLLDIQPNDVCLDMCASPGSKTAQMLVALGRHKVVKSTCAETPFPFDYLSSGLIMANELDTKRANMLVHQCKRLRLLFPFALFCNHDARFFPDLDLTFDADEAGASTSESIRFDKILCDVVCSGDGTIRKAPFIFKIWSPREAIGLQRIQVQIALRACHLLKVGGRLVYSTCSLNPIENEAVVVQIVKRTNGAMKLIDARSMLPNLPCSPGFTTWAVTNNKGEVATESNAQLHPALFPPTEPVEGLDLELCMRLLPHHCNGGGFFIAVFDKVSEFRQQARGEAEEADPSSPTTEKKAPAAKRPRSSPTEAAQAEETHAVAQPLKAKMIPPQFCPATADMVKSLSGFYQIPSFPNANLVVRAGTNERSLDKIGINTTAALVSATAAKILRGKSDSLIIVSAGLRLLAHEALDKGWRITSESAPLFSFLMRQSERVLTVELPFVERLMAGGKLKDVLLEEVNDDELRARIEALPVGTILLKIICPFVTDGVYYSVALRARSRLQLLVDHEDLVGLRLRLGLAAEVTEAAE
jgi:16S rRNA C967 or C1407 C5-methylase (RsmB/RsmF family)